MVHIERIDQLDPATETLLRQRAGERDPEALLHQLNAALESKRVLAAHALNSSGQVWGLVTWRWHDPAQSHAQIILLYAAPDAPPDTGRQLVAFTFAQLRATPTLAMIEARYRDDLPGVREAWLEHGAVFFERCRMARALGTLPLPVLPRPSAYSFVLWEDGHQSAVEELAAHAAKRSIEAVVVPDMRPERRGPMLRHLRQTTESTNGNGTWLPEACYVALVKKQVVGYVATLRLPDRGYIADIAVHPRHQQRGLLDVLLLRAMRSCQDAGLPQIGVTLTVGDPVRSVYDQFGFQTVECGQIAIWWRDNRHQGWF